jgi:hypothetical protein
MTHDWAVRIDNHDYPAENLDMVRAWAREGRLKSSHYVFNPTLQKWMYARDVEELRSDVSTTVSVPKGSTHICTTCRHVGKPVTRVKGSILIEIALWLLLLIPGLIYSIWRLTSKEQVCPSCQQPSMIPLTSPEAQRMIAGGG